MNFLYGRASTAQTSQLLQKIIGFSFPAKADPTNSLTRFKESNLQFATFEGHKLPEIVQCNILVAALNKNANSRNLSISPDGKDAGTIKIEELCNRIIRLSFEPQLRISSGSAPASRHVFSPPGMHSWCLIELQSEKCGSSDRREARRGAGISKKFWQKMFFGGSYIS
jgi:hypothetical protein